jgi:hypothetical protein
MGAVDVFSPRLAVLPHPQRAHRKRSGGGSVLQAELGVDLLEVLVHRARPEAEDLGDVAVRLAARDS